jgi:cell division protein FtsQ
MDPRLRERRVAVKRDEGRRRLRFLVVCLSVVGLAGAGAAATRTPLLDVDRIEITGVQHVTPAQVLKVARLARGDLMDDVDTGAAAGRIEGLPWVARAEVRRQWPATVAVRVVERRAAAAIPAVGGWATVDAEGRVLERSTDPPAELGAVVEVDQVRGDQVPARYRDALAVAVALPQGLLPDVAGVRPGPDGLELPLRAGGVVRFGGTEQLGAKLLALSTILDRVDGPIATIDVRVPDAPVLTRG